jgi:DNA-binding winged helix-turn-helix (wHTH) protein/tetratricopeptide (TPR) repeat protein
MDRPISLEARRVDLKAELPFQLGRGTIDPAAHEYRIGGAAERLQPQALKVLVALHDRIGQVVTREELVDRCWGGRVIGEDVINRSVLLLRRLAAEHSGFNIETIRGTGYRLVETGPPSAGRVGRRIVAGTFAAIAVASAAVLAFEWHDRSAPSAALAVTVIPFTAEHNSTVERRLAADTDRSVEQMLADSGFSLEAPGGSGAAAQSDLLVSGQISNRDGGLVGTVTVEDMHRHAIILSHRLDGVPGKDDDLPDQIGANVAGSLSWADRLIRLNEKEPSDPAVLSQVLDQFSNEDLDFWRTYEFSRRHASSAPNSALAQWQLAMVTGLVIHALPIEDRAAAVVAAVDASNRAVALDPKLGDFRVPWCTLHSLVRMRECEDRLRAAVKIDPQAAWAPSFLAHLMNNVGRTDDALTLDGASLAADIYAPSKIAQAIMMFEAAGDSERARALYQRGVRLWPYTRFLFKLRVEGIAERGDFAALEQLQREIGPPNLPPYYASVLALARAVRAGSTPAAKAACPKDSVDLMIAECMVAFAQLGDLDDAFAYADEVYPPRRSHSVAEEEKLWLADPFLLDTAFLTGKGAAPMRRDPRYVAIAQRLGLLDYWRSGRLPDFCTNAREPVCARIVGRRS